MSDVHRVVSSCPNCGGEVVAVFDLDKGQREAHACCDNAKNCRCPERVVRLNVDEARKAASK